MQSNIDTITDFVFNMNDVAFTKIWNLNQNIDLSSDEMIRYLLNKAEQKLKWSNQQTKNPKSPAQKKYVKVQDKASIVKTIVAD